jgi:hypothetical protein
MTEKKRLVREATSLRPRSSSGRLEREGAAAPSSAGDRERDRELGRERVREAGGEGSGRARIRRGRQGRPPLLDEMGDINRGLVYVGVESTAIAMDIASRVLRGAIDRAFDEDYGSPGDIVRGIAGETDLAVYDLVSELRHVPRRLSYRFDDAVRSPRSDEGERKRKEDEPDAAAGDRREAGRRERAAEKGRGDARDSARDPSRSNGR